MKVLIIGENAKEQALAAALERCGNHQVLVLPGNPGTTQFEQSMDELPGDYNPDNILETVSSIEPDYIIILDEYLIREGWKEKLASRGWNIISPDSQAAHLIDDKIQWTEIMHHSDIPVADFRLFDSKEDAVAFVQSVECPLVFKERDGRKRFAIPYTEEEAEEILDDWFSEGPIRLMISEFENGQRFNLPVFVYKERILPLLPYLVQRGIYENEDDAQAKGMGAVAPIDDIVDPAALEGAIDRIIIPFLKELSKDGIRLTGILSGEFVATEKGPICVNLKTGLSETGATVVFPLLRTDLLKAWEALVNNQPAELTWSGNRAVSVVLAAHDYPDRESYGAPIIIGDDFDASLFMNHVKASPEGYVTDGGRILIVSGIAKTLQEAANQAFEAVDHIESPDLFCRSDIGRKPVSKEE